MSNYFEEKINCLKSLLGKNMSAGITRKADINFWNQNGYLVLEGFFSAEKMDAVNDLINSLWEENALNSRKTVADIYIGTPNERRVCLKNAPADAKKFPFKINDLYLEEEFIRKIILEKDLVKILAVLINGDPLVCNSLNFIYGSQQAPHTDSLYMTPPKELNLIATWIALEDCAMDAGPLRYYPGSHLIPPYLFSNKKMTAISEEMSEYEKYMEMEVRRMAIEPKVFCAKKGDVFIWHSQLLHGGTPIKNFNLTRRSLVTHYFKNGDLTCNAHKLDSGGYWMDRDPQPIPS
jgi:phytanoyl-CoA hydroxylase